VSFETSFNSKQPKLEPKLVSALSETKRLFRLFRFYTETESFDVSIEPKQTEDQPKQFDREHIWVFFRKCRVFPFFWFFRFVSKQFVSVVSLLYQNRDVSIEPKQTEDQPKQFEREHIWVFFWKFRVVLFCFKTVLFISVVSILVETPNKPKQTKHNQNRSCFGLFRFKPKFCLFVSRTPYLKLPGAAGRAEGTDVSLGHARTMEDCCVSQPKDEKQREEDGIR
jgi:hypothetical protein